jgi:hypothetical protein
MGAKEANFRTIYNLRLDEIIVKYAREMNTIVSLSHGGQTHSYNISFVSEPTRVQIGKTEIQRQGFFLVSLHFGCLHFNFLGSKLLRRCSLSFLQQKQKYNSCTPMPIHDQV